MMFLVIESLFLGRLNLKCNFQMILWVLFYKAFTLNQTDLCKVAFHNSSIFKSYKKTKNTKMKTKILSAWPDKTWMAQRNFPFQFLILLLLKYWEKKEKKSEHLNQLKLQFKRYVWKPEDIGQHPPTQTRLYISGPFRDEQLNFWQEEQHLPTSDSNFSEPW